MKILLAFGKASYILNHASTIRELLDRGHTVIAHVFRSNTTLLDDYDLCNRENPLTIKNGAERNDAWAKYLKGSRETLSYSTYLSLEDQSVFYQRRWVKYLPEFLRGRVHSKGLQAVLASGAIKQVLRAIEYFAPPAESVLDELRQIQPQVVVATPTNRGYSKEVEYIKAAKKLGIPTVIPVLSWDNLTTKGLLHIEPDSLLVWNQFHVDEAVSIHRIKADRIVVTGAPWFDNHFDSDVKLDGREEFCAKVGFDRHRPVCLYLGSSKGIAKNEGWLIKKFISTIQSHTDPRVREIQVLIRPHPLNLESVEGLDTQGVKVWPPSTADFLDPSWASTYRSSITHSFATVGVNTTGTVDALLQGKHSIALIVPEYSATQSQSIHFRQLLKLNAITPTHGLEETASALQHALNAPESDEERRERFALSFARPRGTSIPAGAVAAQVIEATAAGRSKESIELSLSALFERPDTKHATLSVSSPS